MANTRTTVGKKLYRTADVLRLSLQLSILAGAFFLPFFLISFIASAQIDEPTPLPHQIYLPALRTSPETQVDFHSGWPAGRSYTVQEGDTLLDVALELGLDLDDVACLIAPTFDWSQPLVIGDRYQVPGERYLCHRLIAGESLASVAATHGVPEAVALAEPWNHLGPATSQGHYVRIPLSPPPLAPVGEPPVEVRPLLTVPEPAYRLPANWPYGSGDFVWPAYGWLTQGFRDGHRAVDIAAPANTPVTAADRGTVIRAGWSQIGYGNYVVIDHGIDYITLYAHLSEISVRVGDVVAKGTLVGRVGSTGNSTGPHLHFEIRDFGQRVDPLLFLSP